MLLGQDTANGRDYMNLALQDGGVALTVKLGIGKLDTQIKTDSVRFDDNQWHHVLVSRESSKVSSFYLKQIKVIETGIQFTAVTWSINKNIRVSIALK